MLYFSLLARSRWLRSFRPEYGRVLGSQAARGARAVFRSVWRPSESAPVYPGVCACLLAFAASQPPLIAPLIGARIAGCVCVRAGRWGFLLLQSKLAPFEWAESS